MDNRSSDSKKWQILSSEYVLRNPWLTVRKDHVRQPSGVEIPDYWVLEYPDWINVIAITDTGDHVIERQYRHAMGWTSYEICAGCVEKGEDPLAAAQRELLEETGFGGGSWEKLMVLSPNGTSMNNMCHCFLARGVTRLSDPHQERTEDIDVSLMSEAEVFRLLKDGGFYQATMAAPLWRYFASRQ
jgi:8-oxo-dGTP pyrophosphatase MutT (NUDIX family)